MSKTMKWGEDPEFSGPRNWFRESLIIQRVNKYAKGKEVLDFGCGSGSLLLRLSPHGFFGKGVDVSELAIKHARERIRKLSLSNKIDVQKGNEDYLLSTQDKFDVLISGETLEHIKDDRKAIKGFYRVLNKGGVCVVSVPAHKKLWDINDNFSRHYRRYDKEELKKTFERVGFRVESSYYWGFPLSLLWHKFVFLPAIRQKIIKGVIYTNSDSTFRKVFFQDRARRILSLPFWFDQLFNLTGLGGGLVLVARK